MVPQAASRGRARTSSINEIRNMMTQTQVNMIDARGLGKRVATTAGHLDILSGIDLQIKRGETLAIVGVSGSGKSTLLGLLAGLDLPTAGEVLLDGQRLNDLDEDGRAQVRAKLVGFVFQSFQLLPSLTALENAMLPLELAGAADPRGQAAELLSRVGLQARLDHYPKQLSGGEQQRVAIARAFSLQPAILFADEPTGNLDTSTGERIIELLFALNTEQRTTLVLVTHDEQLAGRCERRIRLDSGRILNEEPST
jgi:putative ABC transport system ATP-binding protein